jgi:hypothetical protein
MLIIAVLTCKSLKRQSKKEKLFCCDIRDVRGRAKNAKGVGRGKKIFLEETKINGCDNLDKVTGFKYTVEEKKVLNNMGNDQHNNCSSLCVVMSRSTL